MGNFGVGGMSNWIRIMNFKTGFSCFLIALMAMVGNLQANVRIKDIVSLQGVRENQLIGYGLVVGLNGTGDSLRNSPFTENSLKAMLDRLGIGQSNVGMRTKNVAAVVVTAKLPAFANPGLKIDVTVSSIGDASGLRGGTLLLTPLYGADGEVYAASQGALIVSGFSAEGDAASVVTNVPTTGRIPGGASVETAAPGNLNDEKKLVLQLTNPDFNTVISITDRINQYTKRRFGRKLARERDQLSLEIVAPKTITNARFFANIGNLTVRPDTPARIIVDERTGTVIIGANVKVSKVAITHGGLTVSITELPRISQPEPFSDGVTAVEPNTLLTVQEDGSAIGIVEGPDLQQLVKGLNMMGAKPTGIIAILQGIKSAGAIQAELVVQ